jgi:hypothetical protein
MRKGTEFVVGPEIKKRQLRLNRKRFELLWDAQKTKIKKSPLIAWAKTRVPKPLLYTGSTHIHVETIQCFARTGNRGWYSRTTAVDEKVVERILREEPVCNCLDIELKL